jgi:hypothetical protein
MIWRSANDRHTFKMIADDGFGWLGCRQQFRWARTSAGASRQTPSLALELLVNTIPGTILIARVEDRTKELGIPSSEHGKRARIPTAPLLLTLSHHLCGL